MLQKRKYLQMHFVLKFRNTESFPFSIAGHRNIVDHNLNIYPSKMFKFVYSPICVLFFHVSLMLKISLFLWYTTVWILYFLQCLFGACIIVLFIGYNWTRKKLLNQLFYFLFRIKRKDFTRSQVNDLFSLNYHFLNLHPVGIIYVSAKRLIYSFISHYRARIFLSHCTNQ